MRGATNPGLLARAPSGVLVLAGIASVQCGSAVATYLFSAVGPSGAVLLRLVTASVVLVAVARPRLSRLRRHQLTQVALFGLTLAGMNLSFYASLHRIPLGIAVSFEFVGPLGVAVAGSRRAIDAVWVALAAAGIVALTHGGTGHISALGIGFALLAGAFWGAYILLSARVGRSFSGGSGLAVAMCFASLVALPFGVLSGGVHLLTVRSLALGAAVGMLSSALPYSFELEALRRIAAPVFGVLMSLEPAMAALAGLIVLGQGLSGRGVLGLALVVAASLGASLRARTAPVDI
ncbi:MAG: EamA family transporter [Actinomycetota bacterium]|nr:EamA family transporter [Actinomycetota bacterium]